MTCKIVDYNSRYCDDLSHIITRNLFEINSRDYGLEKVREQSLMFTPQKIEANSAKSKIYVALDDDKPVGTLRVAKFWHGTEHDYVFLTIFVMPEYHGNGIGRQLIEVAEGYVMEQGGKTIKIPSSITAHGFYHKLGYDYMNGTEPDADGTIWMHK